MAVTKPWVPEPAARPWCAWFCEVSGSGTVRLHAWGPPKWLSPPCGSHRGRRDPHHSAGCPEGLVNSSCPGLNPQASPWLSLLLPCLGPPLFHPGTALPSAPGSQGFPARSLLGPLLDILQLTHGCGCWGPGKSFALQYKGGALRSGGGCPAEGASSPATVSSGWSLAVT